LFKRKFNTDLPLDTGEELTVFAREKLRSSSLPPMPASRAQTSLPPTAVR